MVGVVVGVGVGVICSIVIVTLREIVVITELFPFVYLISIHEKTTHVKRQGGDRHAFEAEVGTRSKRAAPVNITDATGGI